MFKLSKIDKYLAGIFWNKFIKISGAFYIIIFLVDMLENSRKLSQTFSTYDLIAFSGQNSLSIISEILFFTTFLAIQFSLIQISKTSEIHVIRTSGISFQKILKPFIILTLFISLIPAMMQNLLSNNYYDLNSNNGTWFKEQNYDNHYLLQINNYNSNKNQINDLNIICLECRDLNENSLVIAKNAELKNNELILYEAQINQLDKLPLFKSEFKINFSIDHKIFYTILKQNDKEKYSIIELYQLIKNAKSSGIKTDKYEIKLHKYFSNPLLFLSSLFIAALLSQFRPREHRILRYLIIGLLINFTVYFTDAFLSSVVFNIYQNIILIVYLPKIILLLIFYHYLKKRISL